MWLLWLILVAPSVPGEHVVHHEPYPTLAACVEEKTRLTKEFEKSYPGDTDYTFECRLVRQHT